jgi:hypothetical protein
MVVFNCEASLVVMEQAITGRETPHARPKATLLQIPNEDRYESSIGKNESGNYHDDHHFIATETQLNRKTALTSVQTHRVHSYLRTIAEDGVEFQWVPHLPP